MRFVHRDAVPSDLPRIVEIYNFAVATRESSCDLEPATVATRQAPFDQHRADHRPLWVAQDADATATGVVGDFITADLAIYLHPDYQNKGLGSYCWVRRSNVRRRSASRSWP